MEIETILNLYDSCWFDLDFFKRKPSNNNKNFPEMPSTNPEITPSLPTIHTKIPLVEKTIISSHKHNYSPVNKIDSSFSPNSVLSNPKLQTIFSGKISESFEDDSKSSEEQKTPEIITTTRASKNNTCSATSPLKGNTVISHNRRRKKKGLSKSLSDLEFEELKGFMDLGFIFSEEDIKDSSLASIIPGLQRLGNNNNNSNNACNNIINDSNNTLNESNNKNKVVKLVEKGGGISRPYLSEAWEVMERKRRENELLKSRVPDPHSQTQVQMKDYLRCWAHTVASTVRS